MLDDQTIESTSKGIADIIKEVKDVFKIGAIGIIFIAAICFMMIHKYGGTKASLTLILVPTIVSIMVIGYIVVKFLKVYKLASNQDLGDGCGIVEAASVAGAEPDAHNTSVELPGGTNVIHFKKNITSVTLLKWRERKEGVQPFCRKKIKYLGREYSIDVFDESLVLVDIAARSGGSWFTNSASSGQMTLVPVLPQSVNIDSIGYHRSMGRRLSAEMEVAEDGNIFFITNRFNAFQADQDEEDFIITQKQNRTDEMVLHVNFHRVIADCAFYRLPKAYCMENNIQTRAVPITSTQGKSWSARLKTSNPREKLKMNWRLCAGFPEGPKYIFGYGSLLHPDSVAKTIPNLVGKPVDFVPARLNHFRRSWSAIFQNQLGATTRGGRLTDFIAYMNIAEDSRQSALGVLIPVGNDDLRALDLREMNYVRLDVTGQIETMGKQGGEIDKAATIFTYISFNPLDRGAYEEKVGVRKDYMRLIENASRQIDKKLGRNLFEADLENINGAIKRWPELVADPSSDEGRYKFNENTDL